MLVSWGGGTPRFLGKGPRKRQVEPPCWDQSSWFYLVLKQGHASTDETVLPCVTRII